MIEEVEFVDPTTVRLAVRLVISDPYWRHVTHNCLCCKVERCIRVSGGIGPAPWQGVPLNGNPWSRFN